jgi:hypothetical protein
MSGTRAPTAQSLCRGGLAEARARFQAAGDVSRVDGRRTRGGPGWLLPTGCGQIKHESKIRYQVSRPGLPGKQQQAHGNSPGTRYEAIDPARSWRAPRNSSGVASSAISRRSSWSSWMRCCQGRYCRPCPLRRAISCSAVRRRRLMTLRHSSSFTGTSNYVKVGEIVQLLDGQVYACSGDRRKFLFFQNSRRSIRFLSIARAAVRARMRTAPIIEANRSSFVSPCL